MNCYASTGHNPPVPPLLDVLVAYLERVNNKNATRNQVCLHCKTRGEPPVYPPCQSKRSETGIENDRDWVSFLDAVFKHCLCPAVAHFVDFGEVPRVISRPGR